MGAHNKATTNFWYELQALKGRHEALSLEYRTINKKYVKYRDENKALRKQVRHLEDKLNALANSPQSIAVQAEIYPTIEKFAPEPKPCYDDSVVDELEHVDDYTDYTVYDTWSDDTTRSYAESKWS